jgi:hypothetical protein
MTEFLEIMRSMLAATCHRYRFIARRWHPVNHGEASNTMNFRPSQRHVGEPWQLRARVTTTAAAELRIEAQSLAHALKAN